MMVESCSQYLTIKAWAGWLHYFVDAFRSDHF